MQKVRIRENRKSCMKISKVINHLVVKLYHLRDSRRNTGAREHGKEESQAAGKKQ